MPEKLFPTTDIAVVILIFDRRRERGGKYARRRDILFIDASCCHQAKSRTLESPEINKIATTYKQRKAIEKYASLASFQEVQSNQFNLNIPLYVDTFEPEEAINLKQLQARFDQIESKLTHQKTQITHHLMEFIRHE
ncbi:MAG: N-6 DNA methylase [Chlamydiota bacterium]